MKMVEQVTLTVISKSEKMSHYHNHPIIPRYSYISCLVEGNIQLEKTYRFKM